MVLFSHKFGFADGSLLNLETQVPKRLHPVEQEQGGIEFPFIQGRGSLSEYHKQDDEAEEPQERSNTYHDPVLC